MARRRSRPLLIGSGAALAALIAVLLILDSNHQDPQAGVSQHSATNEEAESSTSESTVPEAESSPGTDHPTRSASDGEAEASAPPLEQEQSRTTGQSISGQTPKPTTLSCFDGDRRNFSSEAEPGSAERSERSECLRSAAQRGEIIAIEGQLLDEGLLLGVGSGSILWRFGADDESNLFIEVTDELIVFQDTCDGRIEYARGVLAETEGSYCSYHGIRSSNSTVAAPNFTIYVIGLQFVAVGEDGWYHIDMERGDATAGIESYASIRLSNPNAGVWIEAEEDPPESGRGTTFRIRRPLAGNPADPQATYAADWEYRVWAELIPRSFRDAAKVFFPDATGYWTVMQDWAAAIMDDLFRNRPHRPQLDWQATEHGLLNSDGYQVGDEFLGPSALLHRIARLMTGDDTRYGPRFVAALLMLYERYIPEFDLDNALALAARYTVKVGDPIDVNPRSQNTELLYGILNRRPDEAPSDYEPIDQDELHLSVTLEVGRQAYEVIVSSDVVPGCHAQYGDDGTFSGWYINPIGEFTINTGGYWNGITLSPYIGSGVGGMLVHGTPTSVGRVRVRVTTQCPEGVGQEPRFVGYSEIIVADRAVSDE